MPKQDEIQIQKRLQRLDDVFHRMIVSLERLEIFLESLRNEEYSKNECMTVTAVHTDRDMHDDNANPPTRDSFFGEVQLDCSALFFQTSGLLNEEIFTSTIKYFLKDLLEWYGGRNDSIPYNGVDAFVLPILVSLSTQVKSVSEIMDVVEKYVTIIPNISSFSDEEKANAISNAMSSLILFIDKDHHKNQDYEKGVDDVVFTKHNRGTSVDGYKRLIMAMLSLFNESMPAILVYRTVSDFLPEVVSSVPSISESSIIEYIENKTTSKSFSKNEEFYESDSEETKVDENPLSDGAVINSESATLQQDCNKINKCLSQDNCVDNKEQVDKTIFSEEFVQNQEDLTSPDNLCDSSDNISENDVPFQEIPSSSEENVPENGFECSSDEKDVEKNNVEEKLSLAKRIKLFLTD